MLVNGLTSILVTTESTAEAVISDSRKNSLAVCSVRRHALHLAEDIQAYRLPLVIRARSQVQEMTAVGQKLRWRCELTFVKVAAGDVCSSRGWVTRCKVPVAVAKRIVSSVPHAPPRTSKTPTRQPDRSARGGNLLQLSLRQKPGSNGCRATRTDPGRIQFPVEPGSLTPDGKRLAFHETTAPPEVLICGLCR